MFKLGILQLNKYSYPRIGILHCTEKKNKKQNCFKQSKWHYDKKYYYGYDGENNQNSYSKLSLTPSY